MSTQASITIGLIVGWYVALSLMTFVTYGIDKRAAKKGESRVPEKRLHTLGLLGGWPGGLLAQRAFKHKRQKGSFMLVFWLTAAAHVVLWAVVGYLTLRS